MGTGPTSRLDTLVGNELSAVCFVRDYIELHFDGPVLRLMGIVSIQAGDDLPESDLHGSRGDDALIRGLLAAIGSNVTQAQVVAEGRFRIVLGKDLVVTVRRGLPGSEYVHFVSYPEKQLIVLD